MESYISYFLPSEILEHFTITHIEELGEVLSKNMIFYIYLEDNLELPQDYSALEYESKGFYPEVYIEDFPNRGKAVYLVIKRDGGGIKLVRIK